MPTLTQPRPAVKTVLEESRVYHCEHGVVLYLVTRTGNRTRQDWYHVTRLDCQDLAFELEKFSDSPGSDAEEAVYHINLDDPSCACSCKGWQRWNHCKHFQAVRTAFVEGALS